MTLVKYTDIWAASYTGIPSYLSILSIVSFEIALLLFIRGNGALDLIAWGCVSLGFLCGLLSCGREVEISNNVLILKYGFPIAIIKMKISNIIGVADINNLKKGRLSKYFKTQLVAPFLLLIAPIIFLFPYLLNPIGIFVLLVTIVMGFTLLTYFMMTFSEYKRYVRTSALTLCILIGILFLEIIFMNRSIFVEKEALYLLFAGYVMAVLSFLILIFLALKRHVILLETSSESYAVIASSEEAANNFMKTVMEKLMVSNVEV